MPDLAHMVATCYRILTVAHDLHIAIRDDRNLPHKLRRHHALEAINLEMVAPMPVMAS